MTPDSTAGRSWRVATRLPVLKLAAGALLLATGLLFAGGDPVRPALAGSVAAALTGWALRDLLLPVRLVADPAGVTVAIGLAGRRRIDWAAIERIRADTRVRGGMRGDQLEIDTGETVYILTRHDLNATPADVAAELAALRATATGQPD
jgi:hypothetical protein